MTTKNLSDLQTAPTKAHTMKELQAMPPKQRVKAFLTDNKAAISAALPKHLNPDRMLQVAQTAITQNPQLLECDTGTLFGALIRCTQLGLEPNNALGQLYLIPFNNRKANRKDVQVIVGYKGMIDLARRSGNIESLQAMAVREGDEFSYEYGMIITSKWEEKRWCAGCLTICLSRSKWRRLKLSTLLVKRKHKSWIASLPKSIMK
jgi:phage RecT family recombinase